MIRNTYLHTGGGKNNNKEGHSTVDSEVAKCTVTYETNKKTGQLQPIPLKYYYMY